MHELVGAYAVDALPDEERRFFERHLDECVDCRGEVDELQATAALLGTAAFEGPPPGMRDRVLAAAAATAQETPEADQAAAGPTAPERVGPRERLRQLLPAVAAVIVLGVAGVTVAITQNRVDDGPADDRLAEVVAAPDAQIVDFSAPEGATARLVWSAEQAEGIFVTEGLGAAPHGHAYALWVIHEETPSLVGMFQPDEGGHASHAITDQLAGAAVVAVTVEPEEGVDAPTTEPLIVGEL